MFTRQNECSSSPEYAAAMPAIRDGVSAHDSGPCALKSARLVLVLSGRVNLRHILLTDKQREKVEKIPVGIWKF